MKTKIGVMGSAGGRLTRKARQLSYNLGRAIALNNCALLTGGCPGLPYEATKGAKEAGGLTIGISPGIDLREHVEMYKSPTEYIDILIYTGSGLMGREVTGVRSCDVVVIVGGRSGTLGEFSIAYDEGRPIGVLEGTGGITSKLREIVKAIKKNTGAPVIYDSNPYRLVTRLITAYNKVKNRRRNFSAAQ